jgi:hypothetical protein
MAAFERHSPSGIGLHSKPSKSSKALFILRAKQGVLNVASNSWLLSVMVLNSSTNSIGLHSGISRSDFWRMFHGTVKS